MIRETYNAHPYQRLIMQHVIEHDRCSIWAGMGLGKTVSVLTALQYLYDTGLETRPTLILAPLRVARTVWPAEAAKWDHLRDFRIVPVLGSPRERRAAFHNQAHAYVMNYENLEWLIAERADWPFGIVIADESTKLKGHRLNSGGKRAKALSRVAHMRGMSRWVNLTGTPAPNGLIDLWGQQWFVDQGKRLGNTFTAYKERWFYPHPNGFGILPHQFAQDQIQARLNDVCLTIDAKDWFDLDEPIVRDIYVELPRDARAAYKAMEDDMFLQIAGADVEAFNAAAMTMKCLQIANGAIYHIHGSTSFKQLHDEKIEALSSIVEESAGAPILVAYQFQSDLIRLRAKFPKGVELDGKAITVEAWNAGKIQILFTHPASAGHGLNLQHGGNTVVFFGHWWDLEQYQQMIERIGPVRQKQSGYDRAVFVYHIYARGTIDETIRERRISKASVQDLLLNAMKR